MSKMNRICAPTLERMKDPPIAQAQDPFLRRKGPLSSRDKIIFFFYG